MMEKGLQQQQPSLPSFKAAESTNFASQTIHHLVRNKLTPVGLYRFRWP